MSVLILSELKTEIRAHMGNRTDLNTRLDGVINLAQLRIARLHDFDELRQTATVQTAVTASAAADKIITFPTLTNARIRKIYSMRLSDPNAAIRARKLRKVLTKNWDKEIPEPEFYARGTPTHYTVYQNNQFELWRVPDAVYDIDIRVSRWPQAVSVTGEGNAVDLENVDDLIINLSVSYLYHSLGREDKGRSFFGIYRQLAKDALNEDDTDYDEAMSGINPRDSFASRGYDDPFVRSVAGDLPYEY